MQVLERTWEWIKGVETEPSDNKEVVGEPAANLGWRWYRFRLGIRGRRGGSIFTGS